MKKILLLTLILITPVAYAASYFFCNKTNQYVSLGNSLEQVQTNCGTPVTTTTKIIPNQKTQKAEQFFQAETFCRYRWKRIFSEEKYYPPFSFRRRRPRTDTSR